MTQLRPLLSEDAPPALKAIVEASTGAPQLVPGTATERRPVRTAVVEPPAAASGSAEA